MKKRNLDEGKILVAVMEIIDGDGPGALGVHRLAEVLGVKASSLYHHFAGLDEIRGRAALEVMASLGQCVAGAAVGRRGMTPSAPLPGPIAALPGSIPGGTRR